MLWVGSPGDGASSGSRTSDVTIFPGAVNPTAAPVASHRNSLLSKLNPCIPQSSHKQKPGFLNRGTQAITGVASAPFGCANMMRFTCPSKPDRRGKSRLTTFRGVFPCCILVFRKEDSALWPLVPGQRSVRAGDLQIPLHDSPASWIREGNQRPPSAARIRIDRHPRRERRLEY